jgi:hypothetical protein
MGNLTGGVAETVLGIYSTTGTMGIAVEFRTGMQVENGDEQSDSKE